MIKFTTNQTLISAVTATTTSDTALGPTDVSLREQITLQLIASGITSGNAVWTVDASNDGTNWITGIAVQDATATASTTYVTSKTQNANGSLGLYVPSGWRYIRVKATVTTDGTYTCVMENGG